jgi:hypothetical protein
MTLIVYEKTIAEETEPEVVTPDQIVTFKEI